MGKSVCVYTVASFLRRDGGWVCEGDLWSIEGGAAGVLLFSMACFIWLYDVCWLRDGVGLFVGDFCRVRGGLVGLVGGWCWMWRVGCAVAFRDVFLTCIVLMGTEFLIYSCVSCGTPGNTSVLVGYYLHW